MVGIGYTPIANAMSFTIKGFEHPRGLGTKLSQTSDSVGCLYIVPPHFSHAKLLIGKG